MMVEYNDFRENSARILEGDQAQEIYHFVAPDRSLRCSWKREDNKKRGRWNRVLRHLCTLILEFQETFMQRLCAFLFLFLVFSFISWLLNSSNLLSYGSKLRRRYTLSLLLMWLGKGLFWKFFSLRRAYDLPVG